MLFFLSKQFITSIFHVNNLDTTFLGKKKLGSAFFDVNNLDARFLCKQFTWYIF